MPGALMTAVCQARTGVKAARTLPSASVSATVSPAALRVLRVTIAEGWAEVSEKPCAIPLEPTHTTTPPLTTALPS